MGGTMTTRKPQHPCRTCGKVNVHTRWEQCAECDRVLAKPEPEPEEDAMPETTRFNDWDASTVRVTRAERGRVRRVAARLLTNEHREFPSSSLAGVIYHARIMVDGKAMCDCRGWTIKKQGKPRQCKHTRDLLGGRAVRA